MQRTKVLPLTRTLSPFSGAARPSLTVAVRLVLRVDVRFAVLPQHSAGPLSSVWGAGGCRDGDMDGGGGTGA